ncbi:MAG: hypothetical protein IKE94_08785 [Aeriscardovia sp.]|nr:hypothetical protein [Aeriscardovia sp.]
MTQIKLVKRYPHIKDEDVTSIFQEGYIKGFANGRKGAIPIEWIKKWLNGSRSSGLSIDVMSLLNDWEKENETN